MSHETEWARRALLSVQLSYPRPESALNKTRCIFAFEGGAGQRFEQVCLREGLTYSRKVPGIWCALFAVVRSRVTAAPRRKWSGLVG